MRIAIVSQWFPPEKAAIPADIAAHLARGGHDVIVITGYPNYPLGHTYAGWRQRLRDRRIAPEGYAVLRVPEYPSHDNSAVRRAASYLSFALAAAILGWGALRRASVVYIYHPPLTAAFGAWLARKVLRVPYVLHVQDLWPESVLDSGMVASRGRGLLARAFSAMCTRVYLDAAAIIVIAPGMRDWLTARGVQGHLIHVVPNWADEAVFAPTPRDPAMDVELDVNQRFTVMFAGNLGEAQALDVAVDAAASVADLSDFQLLMVGDGVALPRLRRMVQDRGLTNVRFIPPQPIERMHRVNASAEAHLVSLRDVDFFGATIPSKLSAILASGLPVICAVAGDAGRVVESANAGWTCRPGNATALAAAFRAAQAAPAEVRQMMGASGRDYYVANLSRAAGTASIAEVLQLASRLNATDKGNDQGCINRVGRRGRRPCRRLRRIPCPMLPQRCRLARRTASSACAARATANAATSAVGAATSVLLARWLGTSGRGQYAAAPTFFTAPRVVPP